MRSSRFASRLIPTASGFSYQPFTNPDWRSVYAPGGGRNRDIGRQVNQEHGNPRAAFEGHVAETAWDDLHLAYFSGYAIWNYLNTPVSLRVARLQDRRDRALGRTRRKQAPAKGDISGSHRDALPRTGFHINGEGLISRLDYGAVVTGGIPIAHYTSEYQDFDGVKIATKRRAYRRRADGTAITEGVVVAIDIAGIRLS